MTLLVRNARPFGGEKVDIAIDGDRISAVGADLPHGADEFDAAGATALPGLHDHHLHVLATAARRSSIDLAGLSGEASVRAKLAAAAQACSPGQWLRVVDYDERAAGLPDREILDRWVPDRRLRLQDRTGALWVLNSLALRLLEGQDLPPGCERDTRGVPTGRFWREDGWLARVLPGIEPDIAPLGRVLATMGVTGLTDAGAANGPEAAATLGGAHLSGELPQRLVLMGDETLVAGQGYRLGPVKLLIDERDLPELPGFAARIEKARRLDRPVAAHCVTSAELALFLAALDLAGGARPGDRIEHGGMIPFGALQEIAAAGLTVVTNPIFIHDRGDRYRATIPPGQWPDLYRAASLAQKGIPLAAGSDAPYGGTDPWRGMRAARDRKSASGEFLAEHESLSAELALSLYLGDGLHPGGPARQLAVGAPGDLVLCTGTMTEVLADLTAERVVATIIAGKLIFGH